MKDLKKEVVKLVNSMDENIVGDMGKLLSLIDITHANMIDDMEDCISLDTDTYVNVLSVMDNIAKKLDRELLDFKTSLSEIHEALRNMKGDIIMFKAEPLKFRKDKTDMDT